MIARRVCTLCRLWFCLLALAIGGPTAGRAAEGDEASLAAGRALLLTGKYAEAEEQFSKLTDQDALAAALGLAQCKLATGRLDEAAALLAAAAKQHPRASRPVAELARLRLARGELAEADRLAQQALALADHDFVARWVTAEVHRLRGELDQADKAHDWFVQFYNRRDQDDPEALRYIGLGAAQFARWNRITDQFRFLVNEFYPDALKLEKNYWPAHYEAGRLFLEKYNQADATRELKRALRINPNAAEVHAALAFAALQSYDLGQAQQHVDQALAVNPRLVDAHLAQADLHLANFDPQRAAEALKAALAVNPHGEEALGRLAAAWLTLDGGGLPGEGSRVAKLIDEVQARNPHAGEFYMALADGLDKVRRFPTAAHFYGLAVERMPQHTAARGQRGLMLMRLGEEDEARKVLKESFDVDPFNLRVSNQLKVLDVLADYATLETPHFIIRYDGKRDAVLARYAAQWLEETYPILCRELGYEPPQKSLFEIFNKAKNTDGHGWFSARMVGLPHLHTIGACAGKIVALQSPTDGRTFNWARVLRHEFVHVLNLQQTNFNIPHWFTEALAVLNEGYPRPKEWNALLAVRLAANNVYNLDTINSGFIRPHSSDDWTLAYCQAALYAEYMRQRFGADALPKILAAYSRNLATTDAIEQTFSVQLADFESGYREFLNRQAATAAGGPPAPATRPKSLLELQKSVEAEPNNVELLAQLARVYADRRAYGQARRLVDRALAIQPKHPLAAFVRARLHLLVGEERQAVEVLEAVLDRAAPQADVLGLLARQRLKANQTAEATALFELGAKHFPGDPNWIKSLAAIYLRGGDRAKLATVLAQVAELDYDDAVTRKKLAEMALADKDHAGAARWAREALQIDVLDAQVHRLLGAALAGEGQAAQGAEELATAVELKPNDPQLHFALAEARLSAGQLDKAREALEAARRLDPKYPGLEALAEKLKP